MIWTIWMRRILFYLEKLSKIDFKWCKVNIVLTLENAILQVPWVVRWRDIFLIQLLSLPTNNEHVELFEKTLTGGFSCANTCLSFDTEILLPNNENPDSDNWKDYSYKNWYNLKLDGEQKYSTKRVISKI